MIETRVKDAMHKAGIDFDDFANRDPHSLSGGEARRLAFAVVTALDREVLIFDEPTCALDEAGLLSFLRLVRELKESGKTVIIISHNGDIIGELADRIMVMRNGKLIYQDNSENFFEQFDSKELLSPSEAIAYQKKSSQKVVTTRISDLVDLSGFYS